MAVTPESALVVLVPEAEALVQPYRDKYDPSATDGMPAHITILYPFRPPSQIQPAMITNLHKLFSSYSSFSFTLAELCRFTNVLYLAPRPDQPFKVFTQALAEQFSETPPRGGKFAEMVPHLTLAHLGGDRERLEYIADEFRQMCGVHLPLRAVASAVTLMDNSEGIWKVRTNFRLGAGLV